jgi:AcrR family transcriptional regulator
VKPISKPGERKLQILGEATSLFAEQGYDGTSIRVIARACGITEAAIYRHFEGKSDLYAEVIRAKAAEHDLDGRLEGVDAGTLPEVLRRVAEQILGLAKSDPELMRLMMNNRLERGGVADVLFSEIRLPFIRFLAADLQRRMDAGEIRTIEPMITARCFVGMVMDCALSIGVWERLTEKRFKADDVVCNNVPIFARGLERTAAD